MSELTRAEELEIFKRRVKQGMKLQVANRGLRNFFKLEDASDKKKPEQVGL